jgi:hypothetical protein
VGYYQPFALSTSYSMSVSFTDEVHTAQSLPLPRANPGLPDYQREASRQ